jgi:hypothetical protein
MRFYLVELLVARVEEVANLLAMEEIRILVRVVLVAEVVEHFLSPLPKSTFV